MPPVVLPLSCAGPSPGSRGGSAYVGRTTKFLYDIGGKWGVLLGSWLFAVGYLYWTWSTFKRERAERGAATVKPSTPKLAKPVPAPRPVTTPRPPLVMPVPVFAPGDEPRFLR